MGTAEEPAAKRPRLPERDVQTMGWLTESTTQPRRHRFVEGVGARGLPEMHAQLYKLEQEAAVKKAAGASLTRPRRPSGPQLGAANAGVAARDKLDRLQAPTDTNRLAESEAALQRKAALYDRLARGEGTEAEEEMYHVDFLNKGDPAAPDAHREQWVAESEQSHAAMSEEEERRQRHIDSVFELERETKEGREWAAEQKDRRKELEDAKRKQLKAVMLKQLAGKIKASMAAAAKPG